MRKFLATLQNYIENATQSTIEEAIEQAIQTTKSTEQAGGGYTTVLGRRRKIVMKGRTKCVNVKGELVAVSKAKAMEKKLK